MWVCKMMFKENMMMLDCCGWMMVWKKKLFEKKNQVPKKKCCAEKNGPFFCLGSPFDIPNVYHLKQKQIKI